MGAIVSDDVCLTLENIDLVLAVCRLGPSTPPPSWALNSNFYSITKTTDELSIVCDIEDVPPDIKMEKDWRCLKVKGPLDFALTGILASLATPLAQSGISIFAISTFDTDYILIKEASFKKAVEVLSRAGHVINL
jgi:uncharacterized protein